MRLWVVRGYIINTSGQLLSMRIKKITALIVLLSLLLIAPATAVSITDSTVTDTNIYAASSAYNIAPAAEIDGTSTAAGITSISNQYLYASSLTSSLSGSLATYNIVNRHGAAVIDAEYGTTLGQVWNYGDGSTATTTDTTHLYHGVGTYTTTLSLSSYLQTTPISLSTTATLASSGVTDCIVSNTNIYAGTNRLDIAPSSYLTGGNTATGLSNVPNRYLYADSLAVTVSGNTATYSLTNQQGAIVTTATNGAQSVYTWDFGDGSTATTATPTTHTYSAGIYTTGLTASNYLRDYQIYTTPIIIGIPTYTANSVTTQDADIVIDAGQLYQAQTQYVLPSTTSDIEFFADNVFVVASGNAVYLIDTATEQIQPVSNTTGTTANKIYLGEHAAIITDVDGNTAVYQYGQNSMHYLASGNSQQIATTEHYAAVVINGKLNIYDLSEPRKIGDITASVSQLAGNDYADTFAGYSGTTITYWWIDNGEIKTASQTITDTITGITQIPQTQNYIVTTEKNTVVVSISANGEYELITTSDTDEPLIHTQATTIGVVIGVHAPNEIYIIGADGSTAGTYQTGAALNDASITKATGLYAITGGNDQQAYILRKDQSSTWTLAQTIKANGAISHTQISTTGNYAAIVSGANLYLLKISLNTDTNYYLQGVVIGSTGGVYADKAITINGEKVTTDSTGRFTYPVTPGTVYEIVADNTRVDYTATNAALQQIAIKLRPNPFAQSVSYSTDYNADTRNFEMIYTDTRDLTSSVTWVIRETGNQTIVSTQTVQAGQTAYWEVPFDKSFTSYQISMIADRQGTNVENVWIITPDGKSPINIPGLDETGRTIIFGAVLMIFGGLFGVMHSTKGALLTVALAGVMTYLGLLNIPWVIIMVAGTIAVAAILGKGSGGS